MTKTIPLEQRSIGFTPQQWKALDRLAKAEERSTASLIRRIVAKAIENGASV